MIDTISINKSNPLSPAEDYDAMRSQGLKLIEQLGHELWTDYNNSDPGITILEAVIYAITDLGYRTGFDIKDLLAPKNLTEDTWKEIFYTARQILHNNPLTITDYRKLIIDIEGVRNAWLEPSKEYEVPVWVDYNYTEVKEPESGKKTCLGRLGLQEGDPNELGEKFINSKIVEFEGLYNVVVEYEENILDENAREEVRQQVVQNLLCHRNLCEDFLTITTVEYKDFGIGASVSLEEYADPDLVLSQIFFTIYKYFTPSIPFYTIQQMQEKGYSIDEIFEGPALQHGFIEESDLEKTNLFRDIRLSDIINELMDIKGVKAITYLNLPFDGFSDKNNSFFNKWIHNLKNEKKVARIHPSMSQIIFCKEREVVTYYTGTEKDRRPNRMIKLFSDLKTAERKYKLQDIPLDLSVPQGENMELHDYYPVTYSLPMTYGVSDRAGLPPNADNKRKIQAQQLKGYLLFFEQILYDYLGQLNHLRDIYTMDATPKQTYFTAALTQLQDLQALLIDTGDNGNDNQAIIDDFSAFLQNLVEPKEQFLERRNTFLNHFLARFGEDVSEYEAISRLMNDENVEQKLVIDKTYILKYEEYKKISSDRGKAYNYADPEFWDNDNISGAERRISRMLGFNEVKKRNLVPEFITVEPLMTIDKINQPVQKKNVQGKPLSVIKIKDPENPENVLLTGVEVMEGCCTEQLITDILTNADVPDHIKIQNKHKRRTRKIEDTVGSFWFEVYDGPDLQTAVLLAESEHYDKTEDRDHALDALSKAMKIINENEGLHLIEHILLRPKLDEVLDEANELIPVSFLDICLDACDLNIGSDEGDVPKFKKKISRTPAEKCYDKMPWVLEYLDIVNSSFLFQTVTVTDDLTTTQTPIKFRRYSDLAKRIEDLDKFGSELANYSFVSNNAETPTDVKYSFIIQNDQGETLAQSLFIYNKKTKEQIEGGSEIDQDNEILAWIKWFGVEMDWYCQPNPCDNNEDPYSFRTTVVLPCWPKRFRDATFKNLVEKTIAAETPAHVHTRVVWLGISEMERFEEAYYNWLEELSLTEIPAYTKVNPVVDVLNTLQACGTCKDDCGCESSDDK